MRIMPTGMHHADLLAIVGGSDRARKRDLRPLNDRQGIHIRAKPDDRPGERAMKDTHHPGLPHPFFYFKAK